MQRFEKEGKKEETRRAIRSVKVYFQKYCNWLFFAFHFFPGNLSLLPCR